MRVTIKDKIFDNPLIFGSIRTILMGGFKKLRSEISKLISKEDSVLDVCCGSGIFSSIQAGYYCGVDSCKNFIQYAKKKYKKRFILRDVCNLRLNRKFDVILFICSLHHFSDQQAKKIFNKLNKITKKKIIIIDVIPPPKWNLISRHLYKLDRGKWIRTIEEQETLIKEFFKIKSKKTFYSFLYKFVLFELNLKNK